ncbi:MAG TPA: hypothetical protein VEW07_10300, partial [Solirubrobacterales bacterium]|nr:hypothetical protein [Solirubrobacterales bacterium]
MKLKMKSLGLMLIASLAIGAMSGSAAQANNLTAGTYPATLTATDLNTEHGKLAHFTIGTGASFIECTKSNLQVAIAHETTSLTIRPSYEDCIAKNNTSSPATITMNSCDYELEFTGPTHAQTLIRCENEKPIEIHIYGSHSGHTANKPICTYDIYPQGPITGIK